MPKDGLSKLRCRNEHSMCLSIRFSAALQVLHSQISVQQLQGGLQHPPIYSQPKGVCALGLLVPVAHLPLANRPLSFSLQDLQRLVPPSRN